MTVNYTKEELRKAYKDETGLSAVKNNEPTLEYIGWLIDKRNRGELTKSEERINELQNKRVND